jgi:hypothetical protein
MDYVSASFVLLQAILALLANPKINDNPQIKAQALLIQEAAVHLVIEAQKQAQNAPQLQDVGSGVGSQQAPISQAPIAEQPAVLQEVDFSTLAIVSWGRFLKNTSTEAAFNIWPSDGPFRLSNSTTTKVQLTMNGATLKLEPIVVNSNDWVVFSGLTPDTDYSYTARVEREGKFGVTSGTVHTGK